MLRRTAGTLLVFALAREPAPAQTAPAVTLNVRLVVLDVVVTGPDGKPVGNLTANDFQVFEDGKLQRIRSLEPPSAHTLPEQSAGAAAVYDPAHPASFGRSPITVLVLDQMNTHFADSSFARREVHDYLARQAELLPQPTSLMSLYDNNFKELHGLTRDRDGLMKTLADAPTKYAWTLEAHGSVDEGPLERMEASLRALEQIAQSYARIPGRKNLIWVGGGFPSLDPTSYEGDATREIKTAIQHVTNELLDTRVTLYAVDPTSSAAGLTEITDSSQLDVAVAAGDGLGVGSEPFNTDEAFDNLGLVTGGRVIRGKNDVARYIASSVELGADYYTLSYTPSSTSDTAMQYRKIQVVCLRPGLSATTRNGYYTGKTEEVATKETAAYDLSTAAEAKMPLNGLEVSAIPDPNGILHQYVVRVQAPGLTWQSGEDGTSTASVYVMAVTYDKNGKMLDHTVHLMKATAKAGTDLRDPAHHASFTLTVSEKPNGTSLRFVVRDSTTGKMGSVDLPLSR